jgi:hypothetical protein
MTLLEHAFVQTLHEKVGSKVVIILTDNRTSIVSVTRPRFGNIKVRVARYFALGDQAVTEGLADYIAGRVKKLPDRVRAFATNVPTSKEAVYKIKRQARPKGDVFDLKQIAAAINQKYFDGQVPVTITWGKESAGSTRRRKRTRVIQFGSYHKDIDLIRIHPVLDSVHTDLAFVELVVYHEMLHKKFDLDNHPDGAGHTQAFRNEERRYSHYAEAMAWEQVNLDRLLTLRDKGGGGTA